MNMELPTFKGLQRGRIEEERGLLNMRFCETNRIHHGAIFGVTPYTEGSYEGAAEETNPVRLEQNETRVRRLLEP
jgi:hypothetical protein